MNSTLRLSLQLRTAVYACAAFLAGTTPRLAAQEAPAPGSADSLYEHGRRCAGGGDYACAEESYRKAVALDSTHVRALDGLGFVYSLQRRFPEARRALERALSLDAGHVPSLYKLGKLFLIRQDPARAEEAFRKAITADPGYYLARHGLAMIHARGDRAAALRHFETAHRINPNYPPSLYRLGGIYLEEQEYGKAIAALGRAAGLIPEEPSVHYLLATARMAVGKLSEAAEALQASLRLDPRRAAVHHQLGRVYAEQAHAPLGTAMADQDLLAASVAAHRRAVELAPGHGGFRHSLGMAYERQREYGQAAAQYEGALAIDPDLAYTRSRLGGIYSREARHEEGIAQLRQAVRLEPENSLFRYALGAAHARADSHGLAIPEFREAVDLDPYNTEAHYGLARALMQQGRREESRQAMAVFREQSRESLDDLERSVAISPDNPKFHAELAVQYSRRGRHLQAIHEHKLAIALEPTNARYHRDLGETYRKVGRYEDARRQLAIARRLAGRSP